MLKKQKGLGKIIGGVLLGGTIGGFLAFTSNFINKNKEKSKDLGYEWHYIQGDDYLQSLIYSLKTKFRCIDEDCYYKIGEACNNIVSLMNDVTNPDIERQGNWTWKSFDLRRSVQKQLEQMATKLSEKMETGTKNIDQSPKVNLSSIYKEEKSNQYEIPDFDEFKIIANALCVYIQNYDHNIRLLACSNFK